MTEEHIEEIYTIILSSGILKPEDKIVLVRVTFDKTSSLYLCYFTCVNNYKVEHGLHCCIDKTLNTVVPIVKGDYENLYVNTEFNLPLAYQKLYLDMLISMDPKYSNLLTEWDWNMVLELLRIVNYKRFPDFSMFIMNSNKTILFLLIICKICSKK